MSFGCPVVPTWLWDGEELQPLAAFLALLTLLSAGTSIFLGLSNLCRTLSDSEAVLTASKNSTASYCCTVVATTRIDIQLLLCFSEQIRLRRDTKSSAQIKIFQEMVREQCSAPNISFLGRLGQTA